MQLVKTLLGDIKIFGFVKENQISQLSRNTINQSNGDRKYGQVVEV